MSCVKIPLGLYPIIDASQCVDVMLYAQTLLDAGVRILQLRNKSNNLNRFLIQAQALVVLCQTYQAQLVINDRVDVALLTQASGVHLGQEDLPIAVARQLLPNALIGLSTHTLAQVKQAQDLPVDYIGFGPVFKTTSKSNASAVCGLDLLAQAVSQSNIPVVAIGGIQLESMPELMTTGVRHVAVISALSRSVSVVSNVRAFNSFFV